MTATASPVRIERDGDVAVVVLDKPPLNLFDENVFGACEQAVAELAELTDPVGRGRSWSKRAARWSPVAWT